MKRRDAGPAPPCTLKLALRSRLASRGPSDRSGVAGPGAGGTRSRLRLAPPGGRIRRGRSRACCSTHAMPRAWRKPPVATDGVWSDPFTARRRPPMHQHRAIAVEGNDPRRENAAPALHGLQGTLHSPQCKNDKTSPNKASQVASVRNRARPATWTVQGLLPGRLLTPRQSGPRLNPQPWHSCCCSGPHRSAPPAPGDGRDGVVSVREESAT
jgi:hypothetical protein